MSQPYFFINTVTRPATGFLPFISVAGLEADWRQLRGDMWLRVEEPVKLGCTLEFIWLPDGDEWKERAADSSLVLEYDEPGSQIQFFLTRAALVKARRAEGNWSRITFKDRSWELALYVARTKAELQAQLNNSQFLRRRHPGVQQ